MHKNIVFIFFSEMTRLDLIRLYRMVFGLFVCLFGGLVSGPILISLSADPLLCAVVLNSIRTTEKLGSFLPGCLLEYVSQLTLESFFLRRQSLGGGGFHRKSSNIAIGQFNALKVGHILVNVPMSILNR